MGSQRAPLRLAILEADTPQPATNAQYNGYGGVFTALLRTAALSLPEPRPLESLVSISVHDVVNDPASYPDPSEIDAILISGSKHNAFDSDPWILRLVEYVRTALEGGRIRAVGVCFGHQIIGRALGVEVKRSELGWEVAVVDVDLTPKGKELFGLETSRLRIHQMHRDIVVDNPPGSTSLATTSLCPVQGFYAPKRYITVQGHPEFTGPIITEIITNRHKQGIFSDEMYKESIARADIEHDGVAVARGFLNFLLEE